MLYETNARRILDGSSNNIRQIWASENCGIDTEYELIYATNDKLNYINNDYAYSSYLPEEHNDLSVIIGV